ncbi:MAG: hypothetical protein LBD85_00125 [Oscillospiraceae bacterium]|jgi:hypothetical protein|nr:hypothetical protein [Oscillospiraceae bacterium]
MYALIKSGKATMTELKEVYTLDESLKLYALLRVDADIEAARAQEIENKTKGRRR